MISTILLVCISASLVWEQEDPSAKVRKLIEQLREDDARAREDAYGKLKSLGKVALPELKKISTDPDREVAARAQKLLRIIPIQEKLTQNLMETIPEVEVRLAVGDKHTWTEVFLEAIAQKDQFRFPRRQFPHLLREDLVAVVNGALDGARNEEETRQVCEWIAWREVRSTKSRLSKLMDHTNPDIRLSASKAIATLGEGEGISKIIDVLSGDEYYLRCNAALALGQLEAKGAVPKLIECLKKDEGMMLRYLAADALGRIGATEATDQLILLLDQERFCRRAASWALGELGATKASSQLVELLDDPRLGVQSAAMSALCQFGAKEVIPKLLDDIVQNGVRSYAPSALLWLDPSWTEPQIRSLLDHNKPVVRKIAVALLVKISARGSKSRIAALLRDKVTSVQGAAVVALAQLGAGEFESEFLQLLKHEDGRIRASAAKALGRLGSRDAVSELLGLLDDEDLWVRSQAAESLAILDSKDAVPKIRVLLKDENRSVRVTAASCLIRLGSMEATDTILDAAEDSNIRFIPLHVLNAVRKAELWRNLQNQPLQKDISGSVSELLASITKEVGVALDVSEMRDWPAKSSTSLSKYIRKRGESLSVLEVLLALQEYSHWEFVLEEDRIILLPRYQALAFWKAWWAEEQKGKKEK